MFEKGFPAELAEDVATVLDAILKKPVGCVPFWETAYGCSYTLSDGQCVCFPYRIYCPELPERQIAAFTPVQLAIYHAVFTRSHDGFLRQKHLEALLCGENQQWMLPYIVKLADEYVVEILELLYIRLKGTELSEIQALCRRNPSQFLYGHARMISYWDVFYRDRYKRFQDYVGKKLFEECFGYTRGLEKEYRR